MAEPFETPFHCGQYRVPMCIGSGAMGTVYEAIDTRLGRLVALVDSKALVFASGVEKAIAKLQEAASARTPTAAEIERNVSALYAALDPTLANGG